MSSVKLYLGDCIEVMKSIPSGSVDFCFTDPPYNVGKNYGEYKDNLPEAEYVTWIKSVLSEIKRVARKVCIFVPQKWTRLFWWELGDDYHQIILTYSPEGAIRWGFVNQHSSLLTNATPLQRTKNVWHNCQMAGLGWFFKENNFGHPGYTSEDITGRVIASFTLPGQTVLDPFSGTGTTAVMCIRMNRNFIGCEKEKHWYLLAKSRIKQAQAQLSLFENF